MIRQFKILQVCFIAILFIPFNLLAQSQPLDNDIIIGTSEKIYNSKAYKEHQQKLANEKHKLNVPEVTLAPLMLRSELLAESFSQNCRPVEFGNQAAIFVTMVPLDDTFFPINGKAKWLPKNPGEEGNSSIKGIDSDGDCVRDDIEHYIAKRFPKKNDKRKRKYLFEYAKWLGQFIRSSSLSESTSQSIVANQYKATECVRRIHGETIETKQLLDRIFSKFHNTYPRSERYIGNNARLSGWITRDNVSVLCP